jgi:hypothetical protein
MIGETKKVSLRAIRKKQKTYRLIIKLEWNE